MIKMLSSSWFSLALVATVAIAQTPTNFSPNSTNHLSVAYGTADIVAGTQLSVDGKILLLLLQDKKLSGIL